MTKKRLTLHGILSGEERPLGPVPTPKPLVTSGPLKAMTDSLQRMSEGAADAVRLREELERSERVVEISTDAIDGSFVNDRLDDGEGDGIDGLAESIKESGQQIPVLLRPHPDDPDRYQIAYGHRRVKAARQLGIAVKAIIRKLTDEELIVAQGKENLDRRDLSFIERAWFARSLEESVLITVARSMPYELLKAIGPAPRTGRPRWLALTDAWKAAGQKAPAALLGSPEFQRSPSDERFALVLRALTNQAAGRAPQTWTAPDGRHVVTIRRNGRAGILTVDEKTAPLFTEFLVRKIPELFEVYLQQQKGS
jgi:ParB family transcriptional regulator, chromosome partitioning protein